MTSPVNPPPMVFHDSAWGLGAEVGLGDIGTSAVHAWLLDLSDERHGPIDASWLPDDERRAADAFATSALRQRALAVRILTRRLLGACLDAAPESIVFARNASGKPSIERRWANRRARSVPSFNLSHSENLLLLAVSYEGEIGVDVEIIQPGFDILEVAGSHFSQRERQQLNALPEGLRREAFYCCWTQKEAALKTLGVGVSAGLDLVEVEFDGSGGCRLDRVGDVRLPSREWTCWQRTVTVGPVAAATAICVRKS